MAERVLILGGTREAAQLAAVLVADGNDVLTSLAGRTREPLPVAGQVRVGGFGGAAGLATFLSDGGFDRVIDATHPFAANISRNAEAACHAAGVPLEVRLRPAWDEREGDRWDHVQTIADAVQAVPSGETVLLALGSQHLAPFALRRDVRFVVRMVDRPANPLPLHDFELVLGRPSADPEVEADLLASRSIERIVCRNSGGEGAYAKIVAARQLGLPVTMIARPRS